MESTKLRLLFLGQGRLAQVVAQAAQERGHQILGFKNSTEPLQASDLNEEVDLVMDTALPQGLMERAALVLESSKPLVIGTTGWYDRMPELQALCHQKNGSVLWASNFAPGVQIFRSLAAEAVARLAALPGFRVELHESHHLNKKDQPSGTAVHTAMDLLKARPDWQGWVDGRELNQEAFSEHPGVSALPIFSHRDQDEVGTHTLRMRGPHEEMEWTHKALDRQAFGWGAVAAAEWLSSRKGWFSVDDFYRDFWTSTK
ncbi:MAG: 4-hydroxy-tetrahydrodipicolinate reductase [Bacteroidia bacterium]